jgi:Fur family ferric uptake transcriptional regulator
MSKNQPIIDYLRTRGYRITPQREMIIGIITKSPEHLSAEEIFAEVQKSTKATNIATVYRTLEMLWGEGLACRNDLSEGKIVYAAKEHGTHIHLICRHCNQVFSADPQVLENLGRELALRNKFKADLEHLSIFGICSQCIGKEELEKG